MAESPLVPQGESLSKEMSALKREVGALVKVTKTSTALAKIAAKDTKELNKAIKGMSGGLLKGGFRAIATTLVDLLFAFPPQLKKIEEFGARFSKSFQEASVNSQRLSESIRGGVDVYDSFVMSLNATRRGLNDNSAFLGNLAIITKVTGENITELLDGMMRSTIGLGDNNANLAKLGGSMEFFSRAFNRSRTELVKAMTNLTQETLNLVAMGGARGVALQEGFMMLKSFIPEEGLFQSVTQGIQKLLSPAGLTQSLILGFDASKFLTGQATAADLMMSTLKLEQKAMGVRAMAARSGAGVQASLGALRNVFGDMGIFLRGGNAIRQMASKLNIDTANKTSKQIVDAIVREGSIRAAENNKFAQTITQIQNEIFRPLKNAMANIGLELKGLLSGSAGWLQRLVKTISSALLAVMEGIIGVITTFVGGQLDTDLKLIQSSIGEFRADFAKSSGFSSGRLDAIARNTDPTKSKRDMKDAMKQGNLFAVRQTDALLLDIYTTMLKNTKIQEAMSRRGLNVVVKPAGDPAQSPRLPVKGR
jgi:hypothetical protein